LLIVANIALTARPIVAILSLIGSLLPLFRCRCFGGKNRRTRNSLGELYGD
jgi:hypothetical protein